MSTPLTRPVYWTVRRELWENRSIYLAPAIVGALEMAAILISVLRSPGHFEVVGDLGEVAHTQIAMAAIYGGLGAPILVTALIVAAFYCLDTLYSERRDRSILFWKSLPVSDSVTVLSKALIPLVILPAITLAVICVTQIFSLLAGVALCKLSGADSSILWSTVPVATMPVALAYVLTAMSFWYAPLYGWLFLVSAFARRKAILWALLPPAGICIIERLAFDTDYATRLLADRFLGFMKVAFHVEDQQHPVFALDKLTPVTLLTSPGLWGGLVAAALFFAATIKLRRYRDPV